MPRYFRNFGPTKQHNTMKTQSNKLTRTQVVLMSVGAAIIVGSIVAFFAGFGGVPAFLVSKVGVGVFAAGFTA